MESADINCISTPNNSSSCTINQPWNNFPFIDEKDMKIEDPYPTLSNGNSEQGQLRRTEGEFFRMNVFRADETKYPDMCCNESTQVPPPYDRSPECVNCGLASSKYWAYDKAGNPLCVFCSNQNDLTSSISKPLTQSAKKLDRLPPHFNMKNGTVCSNCRTPKTSLWRRAPEGDVVCNACGLYRKMHGRQRPLTMRKDSIQTRKRRSIKIHADDLTKNRLPNPHNKCVPREINISTVKDQDRLNINKDFQAAFGPQYNFQSHQIAYGHRPQEPFPSWYPESSGMPQLIQQRFPDAFSSYYYQTPHFPTENINNVLKMSPSVHQQSGSRFGAFK